MPPTRSYRLPKSIDRKGKHFPVGATGIKPFRLVITMPQRDSMKTVKRLKLEASQTASDKGFWDDTEVDERFPQCIALIHSELSEALEAHRDGNYGPDFNEDSVSMELADTVIRILDLAEKMDRKHGSSFEQDLYHKMRINQDREYKHGKEY